jgi:hypothetical protein
MKTTMLSTVERLTTKSLLGLFLSSFDLLRIFFGNFSFLVVIIHAEINSFVGNDGRIKGRGSYGFTIGNYGSDYILALRI